MSKMPRLRRIDALVLVLCVAVLVACLGATGETGRKRAKEVVCLAHLQQWGSFFLSYIDDHDGYFNPGWQVGETELWLNALRPYYQDRWPLLFCPTAKRAGGPGINPGTFIAWSRSIRVPGGDRQLYVSSYGINSWTNNQTSNRGSRMAEWFWRSPRDIPNAHRVPVFADSIWHDAWPQPMDWPAPVPIDRGWADVTSEMNQFCIDRHNGAVNFLFMDFSARKVGLKELWTLKWHRQFNTAGPWTKAGGVTAADWPQWMRGFKDY